MLGHDFLKMLGRTKLRPGGGLGSKWLFETVDFHKDMDVLEVACNQGDNLIYLQNKYGIRPKGIDLDEETIDQARENIRALGLEDQIQVQLMDAMDLDYSNQSQDLVINEAMLTMFTDENKAQALSEYYRVLRPGGKVLTHDVCLSKEDEDLRKDLSQRVAMSVYPLTKEKWIGLFESIGFKNIQVKTGPFLLIDKKTVIEDEGPIRAAQFYKEGQKAENKERFDQMSRLFAKKDSMAYILISAEK